MERDLLIIPPTTFAPTVSPGPSAYNPPVASTHAPSASPTVKLVPRLVVSDGSTVGFTSVSCEDSFLDGPLSNYNVLPPFLEDLTLSFEYEAHILTSANVTEELIKLQTAILHDVALQTSLVDGNLHATTTTCNELILNALNIEIITRKLVSDVSDWNNFLGLSSEPAPEINTEVSCDSVVTGTDCHVVIGYVTTQVPVQRELDEDSLEFVISQIKLSMDNGDFDSTNVPKTSFIGSRDSLFGTEGERPSPQDPWYFDGEKLSLFGILAIVALSLIVVLLTFLFIVYFRRRNNSRRQLDKIQNDALLIAEDELASPQRNTVFIDQVSPDSVEVVDTQYSPNKPLYADTELDNTKVTIGAFMDNIRRRDDISYADGLSVVKHDDDLSYDDESLQSKQRASPTTRNFFSRNKKKLAEPVTPTRNRSFDDVEEL